MVSKVAIQGWRTLLFLDEAEHHGKGVMEEENGSSFGGQETEEVPVNQLGEGRSFKDLTSPCFPQVHNLCSLFQFKS